MEQPTRQLLLDLYDALLKAHLDQDPRWRDLLARLEAELRSS